MFLVVKKEDKALGGRLTTDKKHIIVATIEDGLTMIEKIEANLEDIGEFIEKASDVFFQIKNFFDDLLNRLPSRIKDNGKIYRLNELPAPGRALDIVCYRNEANGNEILFKTEGHNRSKARNEMFALLQEENFIF